MGSRSSHTYAARSRSGFPKRFEPLRTAFRVIFAVFVICCASTCASSTVPLLDPPYRIWQAETFIIDARGFTTRIYWLNDETLVFAGYTEQATTRTFRNVGRKIFLWKLGDVPHPYQTQTWDEFGFCAEDGVIAYSLRPPDGVKFAVNEMRGALGEEVEVPISKVPPATGPLSDAARTEDTKCRRYTDPRMVGRLWVADATRRFYLDFGAIGWPRVPQNVVLQRADGTEQIELPLSFPEPMPSCTHSPNFVSEFLAWDCIAGSNGAIQSWRESGCWPVWKIALPGGAIEKICIPYGPWVGATFEIVPTKAGMFFMSLAGSGKDGYSAGEAGFYRMQNGSLKRVLSGLIEHIRISPSGCKVAFVYAPYFMAKLFDPLVKGPDRSKVVVIDVCSRP